MALFDSHVKTAINMERKKV